ncbi:site-specific integrase [Amycolatopsis sp. CA-230715]|uniref:site-specific integrase n=1 Tax=Amycolatopsis sp. CA-230715 TaxID=2745196 RepID=UPI0020B381E2|nr:tyrosine-type recombinase/integrase [Amycolatopsis sp. CA-230715]
MTVGYTPSGKRRTRKVSDPSKTEAKTKLDALRREIEDEGTAAAGGYSVERAVRDWLRHGLNGRAEGTVAKLTTLAEQHVIPALGARLLRDPRNRNELTPDDVDSWLEEKAEVLATRTLQDLRAILRRSIHRAQKRDKVKRNVALLCDELPIGQEGRPSKALMLAQAEAVLAAAEADDSTYGEYIVVSLLTGARTEEARPLEWDLVDLSGDPDANPPVPPHIDVWRSVRMGGDTKTRKSRRSLALAQRGIDALRRQHARQRIQREAAGARWQEHGLVFASDVGTELDAANVRRGVRRILGAAGLNPNEWTPRELRHSFVSLLSDSGVPIDQIALLVGHTGTTVTEQVYRHQIRPTLLHGALAMDRIFPIPGETVTQ